MNLDLADALRESEQRRHRDLVLRDLRSTQRRFRFDGVGVLTGAIDDLRPAVQSTTGFRFTIRPAYRVDDSPRPTYVQALVEHTAQWFESLEDGTVWSRLFCILGIHDLQYPQYPKRRWYCARCPFIGESILRDE